MTDRKASTGSTKPNDKNNDYSTSSTKKQPQMTAKLASSTSSKDQPPQRLDTPSVRPSHSVPKSLHQQHHHQQQKRKKESTIFQNICIFFSILFVFFLFSVVTVPNIGRDLQREAFLNYEQMAKQAELEYMQLRNNSDDEDYCGLYWANTSLMVVNSNNDDVVVRSVFAGRFYQEGEVLFDSGIAIPLVEHNEHAHSSSFASFNDYIRNAGIAHTPPPSQQHQTGFEKRIGGGTIAPHLHSLIQHHPHLDNVQIKEPSTTNNNHHRVIPNISNQIIASRDIQPGEELFFNYYPDEIHDAPPTNIHHDDNKKEATYHHHPYSNHIPTLQHYQEANDILLDLTILHSQHTAIGARGNVIKQIKKSPISHTTIFLLKRAIWRYSKIVSSILPNSLLQLLEINKKFGGDTAYSTLQNRSVLWLDNNGYCLDSIEPGDTAAIVTDTNNDNNEDNKKNSSITIKTRGAFVKRKITKGELITPAPVFILNHTTINPIATEHQQLPHENTFMNHYCFGHSQSSVLICPSTFATLIQSSYFASFTPTEENDKCQDSQQQQPQEECAAGPIDTKEHSRANAEYQWSAWNKRNEEYTSLLVKDVFQRKDGLHGMSLDIIATRNISIGEEILIDYGKEWTHTFKKHVEKCQQKHNKPQPPNNTIVSKEEEEDVTTQLETCILQISLSMFMKDDVFPVKWKNLHEFTG